MKHVRRLDSIREAIENTKSKDNAFIYLSLVLSSEAKERKSQ